MRLLMMICLLVVSGTAIADRIAIIGTGNVAGALGPEFAAQGHAIVYGSRDPNRDSVRGLVARTGGEASATTQAAAVEGADVVVLAVPGALVEEITRNLGDLSGKIIIDPTNPMELIGREFVRTTERSNAEVIQAIAPDAHVVKALNTLTWSTMVDPEQSGGPVSIPLVGDNDDAKGRVAELISAMGLDPIDVGPLKYGRWVEGMLILWINNRTSGRETFDFYLRRTGESR